MKSRLHHYFELLGLIIILLATTLQLTLLTEINDISNKSAFLRIEEKMNIIWFEITDTSKNTNLSDSREQYFNSLTDNGYRVDKQQRWLNRAYVIVMLIGSVLLIWGRWLELNSYKE